MLAMLCGVSHAAACILAVVAMEIVPSGLGCEAAGVRAITPSPEPGMDAQENAWTTPHSRMLIVTRLAMG
ncbi:hypothetical protein ACFQS7_17765 [Dankookia sp. GCM10030260]|uniref:hypothetical protein n=1 Tax=Dankookia sp. GCM10030260 TaxID=3273390 RepID=UPI0036157400